MTQMGTTEESPVRARLAHISWAETKLAEARAKLLHVERKFDYAVVNGRIGISEQLLNARRQAAAQLEFADAQLEQMRSADETDVVAKKAEFDDALSDLLQSIRKFVDRLY